MSAAREDAIAVIGLAGRFPGAGSADALRDLLRRGERGITTFTDAELFERTYGAQKPALSAQIAFAVGAHDIEPEDFAGGAKRLSAAMKAIEEAEKAYLDILNLPIAPPPRWSIASSARRADVGGKFVAEFRAAPVPKEWKQKGPSPSGDLRWEEILGEYLGGIDVASEPYKQRAKQAFVSCVDYSAKYQFSDEQSRGCEV